MRQTESATDLVRVFERNGHGSWNMTRGFAYVDRSSATMASVNVTIYTAPIGD